MKKKTLLCFALALILSGCNSIPSHTSIVEDNTTTDYEPIPSAPVDVDFAQDESDMFSAKDYEVGYNEEESIVIQLNKDSISCDSKSVNISGTTITITDEGTYIIKGTLDNGSIIINTEKSDKVHLILNNASVNSSDFAPLYISQCDKVFVTLEDGSSNTLSCGEVFTAIDENNVDGAVYSKADITFNGSGGLKITSPGGHGIVAKDDIAFTSGSYIINSASHGIRGNDSVRIANADFDITSGKDGIHSENSDDSTLGFVYISSGDFSINAQGDGISAVAYMQIEGGTYDIVTGGGSINAEDKISDKWGDFMGDGGNPGGGKPDRPDKPQNRAAQSDSSSSIKALKCAGHILINNGTFKIDSADDSVHSNLSVNINGGDFTIASGDDAFHADEDLTVTSGKINVTKSYEGFEALNITVSGGDISLVCTDDGINCAGGNDESGLGGFRENDKFGGAMGDHPGNPGNSPNSASSNGSIVITNGKLYIESSGDGIDANGSFAMNGGEVTICGPNTGDTATLDYDISGVITGGTFIGTGARGMAQSFSNAAQGVIAVSAGSQKTGTEITLKDNAGKTLITHTPKLDYSVIILSTPDLIKGETYTITVGTLTGEFTAQ